MDFRQLETFVEVAKMKSFSKAANNLYITQPTVTNHIQSLEKELDTILINRLGKTISLTRAGNILFTNAIHILNSVEKTRLDLSSYEGKIEGHINIFSSSIPRNYFLPPIIKDFLKDYPDVSFSIGDQDSKNVIQAILDGDTDFGILGAKYNRPSIEYLKLMEDELLLVCPNDDRYPWENYGFIEKDLLGALNLILREEGSGTRRLIEKTLEENNLWEKQKVVAYVEDTDTIRKMISLDIGVSFMSKLAVKDLVDSGEFKAFYIKDLSFKRNFYLAYHKNRQLSPLNEKFKDYILKNKKS